MPLFLAWDGGFEGGLAAEDGLAVEALLFEPLGVAGAVAFAGAVSARDGAARSEDGACPVVPVPLGAWACVAAPLGAFCADEPG